MQPRRNINGMLLVAARFFLYSPGNTKAAAICMLVHLEIIEENV